MAENFQLMPDYLAALEVELRAAAGAPPPQTRFSRTARWQRPVLVAAFVATAVAILLVLSTSIGRETRAYAAPPIISAPGIDVPAKLTRGLALQVAAGAHGPLDKAWPIKAAGVEAYVVRGRGIFCLWERDARSSHDEPAVHCDSAEHFYGVGLWLTVGGHYIAALPDGVPNPTLTHPNGGTETLHPDDQGVVKVDEVAPGDTITLHGTDGQELTTDVR